MLVMIAEVVAVLGEHQLCHIPAWSSFCTAKRLAGSRIFFTARLSNSCTYGDRSHHASRGAEGPKSKSRTHCDERREASAEMLRGDGICSGLRGNVWFEGTWAERKSSTIYLMV